MESEFSLSSDTAYLDHPNTPCSHFHHLQLLEALAELHSCISNFTTISTHEGLTAWHFSNKWQILRQEGQMISEPSRYQNKNLFPCRFLRWLSLFLQGIVPAWLRWHSEIFSKKWMWPVLVLVGHPCQTVLIDRKVCQHTAEKISFKLSTPQRILFVWKILMCKLSSSLTPQKKIYWELQEGKKN